MASKSEVMKAIAGLVRAGIRTEDANRLIASANEDPRRVLALVSLRGQPAEGDRIRAVVAAGPPQALEVIAFAEAVGETVLMTQPMDLALRRWAVVGTPVAPSPQDAEELRGRGRG
jgi:uncharacterized protein (UPF0548 family)